MQNPQLQRIVDLPRSLRANAIEEAVEAFVRESHITDSGCDGIGLFNQIIEAIASITIFKNNPSAHFWLAEENGEVAAWALAHMSKDVDNQLSYWMTDAWVAKAYRNKPIVKEWFNTMRNEGKRLMCRHLLIPSSRNTKAYLRFLGRDWTKYLTILKEDI